MIDDSTSTDERDPTEIVLQGEGPFILPFCDSEVEIGIGDAIVLLTMTTLDGQELQIPFGRAVLQQLHALAGEALAHLARDGGETLQ